MGYALGKAYTSQKEENKYQDFFLIWVVFFKPQMLR